MTNIVLTAEVFTRIETVARAQGLSATGARDVAFHMHDWIANLDAWVCYLETPDAHTDAQLHQLLVNFLVHVPAHVAAASRLYTGYQVTDVFGVDAVG